MRKFVIVLCAVLLVGMNVYGQQDSVTVTFIVNTAVIPDTMNENSVVQLRGGTSPMTWDNTSVPVFTNIGGDYWTVDVKFDTNSTVEYKVFTNPLSSIDGSSIGWEAGDNRSITLGTADTTLPVQFANGLGSSFGQYDKPYGTNADSVYVWIRVNMHGIDDFNSTTQKMGARGSGGTLDWGQSILLNQESNHANTGQSTYTGGHFWSGEVRFHKDSVTAGDPYEYKFVIHDAADLATDDPTWEGIANNRTFTIPTALDTTLHFGFYENTRPVGVVGVDTIYAAFSVDMTNAIANNGFAHGDDTLLVALGWGGTGRDVVTEETPMQIEMIRQGFTQTYAGDTTFIGEMSGYIYYQYYKSNTDSENREIYYNFDYTGDDQALQERREFTIDSDSLEVNDTEDTQLSARRMPIFRNADVIAEDVLVTFTCDLRPAIYQVLSGSTLDDIQGDNDVSVADSVIAWGLYMNGPATGGWGTWSAAGLADYVMYDDGTNGDATPNDTIYSIQIQYYVDSSHTVGQEFKFGIYGGDNEGGTGGFGNNHVDNIDDSGPTATVASSFGSMNPSFYDAWNYEYDVPTSVELVDNELLPDKYELKQNYPNPFNPVTSIYFSIPQAANVRIEIFNVLGQKIGVLLNEEKGAGTYHLKWDGTDSYGRRVASGVYIYRMVTDNFVQVRKMMLIK